MNFLKALKTKPKENKNIPEVEIEKTFDKEGNKIINGYKVLEYIGCGSYSKVKLVEKNGQKYAMKIINKENLKRKKGFLKNKDGKVIVNSLLENAMKEIAILKKTNHKNIIKLYEIIYNNEKNKMYLILEYIQNGNLITFDEEEEMFVINENYVKENKEIEKSFYSEDEIRNFVRDISLGINYLHHQGIIHRDIKPDNILINDKFICKITDFNVSAMLPDVNNDDIGKKIVGTDLFRAPETCMVDENGEMKELKGKPLDIWALGITTYLIAYRNYPFKLGYVVSPLKLFKTIINNKLVFPDEINENTQINNNNDNDNNNDNKNNTDNDNESSDKSESNISEELDYSEVKYSDDFKNFIRGCLEKNPEKRFTIQDILNNKWINENCVPLKDIQDLEKIYVNKMEINDCIGFFEPKKFIKNYADWAKERFKNCNIKDNIEKIKISLSPGKLRMKKSSKTEIENDNDKDLKDKNSNDDIDHLINIKPISKYFDFDISKKQISEDEKNKKDDKEIHYNLKTIFMKRNKNENLLTNINNIYLEKKIIFTDNIPRRKITIKNNIGNINKLNNPLLKYMNNYIKKPLILPKIDSFSNRNLNSLEYEALKRKDSYEKLKVYNSYKLMLVQKYNALQERKKSFKNIFKNKNKLFTPIKKNEHSYSNEKTISPEVCLAQKINKNLSLIKIKFPNFNSYRKKSNYHSILNHSDLSQRKFN